MAKSQKRSNREKKKPKSNLTKKAPAAMSLASDLRPFKFGQQRPVGKS